MVRAQKYRGEDGLEWFIEEPFCWDLLLEKEKFPVPIWDPCCGMGQSLMAFERAGYARERLMGSDIVDRCRGNPLAWQHHVIHPQDFLATRPTGVDGAWATVFDTIVMNPPYGGGELALRFIRHALKLARRKVAVIASARLLGSAERGGDWLTPELRPTSVYWYSNRPTMPPGDKWLAGEIGRVSGGEIEYVALVWEKDCGGNIIHPGGRTEFDWLHAPGHTLRRLGQPAGPLLAQMSESVGRADKPANQEADNV